ncbi:MAG: sulfotransferase, partial [Candidatus Thermoplasmatota archaeon]|nr:sulfotransferase [Candidatus Thermoplasmatota archaeon]
MKKVHTFEIDPLDVTFEPLAGSTFTNLLRLLGQNHFKVSMMGMPRIMYSLLLTSIQSPLNVLEKRYFNKHIRDQKIKEPPIFILGHWRSGTTYLHNLLAQDKRYAYPTTLQTVIPALFLKYGELFRSIVEDSLPETRPEDNVALGVDLPQEEEYALGNLSPYSFYNGWCFPKKMDLYNNYVDFQNISPKTIEDFKHIYIDYLKKVSYYHKYRRLILKNPSNTARVKLLLELFPDAKFIFIYRNPYHVYLSMKRNIEKEMTLYTVQKPPPWEIFEKAMVAMYKRMFKKYFEERALIPKRNLFEVKYEDFVSNPLGHMEKIYKELDLKHFDKNKEIFKKYIASQSHIKSSKYEISPQLQQHIFHMLKDTIDRWGYTI